MPVKPTDTVKPWGTAGNYPVGNYPLFYPWDTPNPLGGNPYPWNSQPRIEAGDITGFAANGLTPQIPNAAEPFNRWLNTVYQNAEWVELGTSAADADAHIMETNGAGLSSALGYEATASFQGIGSTPAPLAQGAIVTAGMTITLDGDADIAGGAGSQVAAELTLITERRWVDSATTLPASPGRTRWNDTFYSVHDAAGNVHTFDEPARGYGAQLITLNAIDNTGAICSRRVKQNEPVWITIKTRFEGTVAASLMNYRILANGPMGAVDILIDTAEITNANAGYFMTETFQWTPTDTWPGEVATQGYSFEFRAGVTAGTLTADRASINAVSAWQI